MTKGTPQALLGLLACILLILQVCGARQLVQVDGSNDGSTDTTEAQLADAIKVISTINDRTTPEDIRVVVDLDALLAVGTADQDTGDSTDSSSGARRRLLQGVTSTSKSCPAPECNAPANTNSVLVFKWDPAKTLTLTPAVATLGPTTLKRAELPQSVKLNLLMAKVAPNKGVTSSINNGTTNTTLGFDTASSNQAKVFIYTLPRSYVVAPGNTTVYVQLYSIGSGAPTSDVLAVWLNLGPVSCLAGSKQIANETACEQCPANTYGSGGNATTCTQCPEGTSSPAGSAIETACANIDACNTSACINSGSGNVTCTDNPPPALGDAAGRNCSCAAGYTYNQTNGCQDINACINNPCKVGNGSVTCADKAAPFLDNAAGRTCTCAAGYAYDPDRGCQDIDACQVTPCTSNGIATATCVDLAPPASGEASGRTCTCPDGYSYTAANGCQDVTDPELNVPSSTVYLEATGSAAANTSSNIIDGAYFLNLLSLVNATDNSGSACTIACQKSDGTVITNRTAIGPLATSVTLQCTATDPSGNKVTKNFTVLPERCEHLNSDQGAPFFLDPVKNSDSNVSSHPVTGSQTLPLKWSHGGFYGMSLVNFRYQKVACPTATEDVDPQVVGNATATNGKLIYDASTQQYAFNLQVSAIQPSQVPSCYKISAYNTICSKTSPHFVIIKVTKLKRFLM